MAGDIESLIRQALARQNGFDPQVRLKIYQSSRNALAKIIAKSGVVPPNIIESRNRSLENTIRKIETEFTSQVSNPQTDLIEPNPNVSPDPARLDVPTASPPHSPDFVAPNLNVAPVGVGPQVNLAPPPAARDRYADPTPQHIRPRRKPIRYVIWIIALAILAIFGWIAYMLTVSFLDPQSEFSSSNKTSQASNAGDNEGFLTILEPTQPSALITGGNGTAEILSDISQPAIRITSVRKADNHDTQAEPLLLELAPGILESIAGKKATVEIRAKSGDVSPATFAVVCDFGALGECGRKRFRVGLQPEAVVFSILISADLIEGQRAFLAINTDVTSAAAITGKGAKIDIIYARIRPSN